MLPSFLRNKKTIVRVPGAIQKSLAHCYIMHHLKKQQQRRVSEYDKKYQEKKLYKIEYPVKMRHVNFIRYDLHQVMNIYTIDDENGHERRCIYFLNERASDRALNVLFYKGRFYLIRNFNRFACGNRKSRRRRYYCERCLLSFTNSGQCCQHQINCKHELLFALRFDGSTPIAADSLPEECEPAELARTKDLQGTESISAIDLAFGKFVPNFDDRNENDDDIAESRANEEYIVPPTKMEEDDGRGTLRKEEAKHTAANEDEYTRSKKMQDDDGRGEKTNDGNDRGRKMGEHDMQLRNKQHDSTSPQRMATELWQDANTMQSGMETSQDAGPIHADMEGKGHASYPILKNEQMTETNDTAKSRHQPKVNVEASSPSKNESLSTMQDKHVRLQILLALQQKRKEARNQNADELNTQEGRFKTEGDDDVLPDKEPAKKDQHKANNSSVKAPVLSVQNDLNRLIFLKEQCMRRQQARKEAEGRSCSMSYT